MRILRVADVLNNRTGGMSRVMHCTGDVMRARGHRVDYLFGKDIGASTFPWLRRFSVPLRLPLLVSRMLGAGNRYDVVEIHEPLAGPYCAAQRMCGGLPPVVVLSYGLESRSRLAKLDYMRRNTMPISLKQRYASLSVVWQAQYAVCHADHVLCPNSEDVAQLLNWGVPLSRVTQYHSGVDDCFLEAGEEAARQPRRDAGLLFLGTWIMRKGVMDLARAATKVLKRHPSVRLTVAGCRCEAAVVMADFPPDVRTQVVVIPELASDREVIGLMARSRAFVLPSFFEGQPLSMIEAAAMGLAVVSTNTCGMRDFVEQGVNGLLVDVGDDAGLSEALELLVRDEAEARRLGEAARKKARRFTWASAAALMEAAYERAAGLAARRSPSWVEC